MAPCAVRGAVRRHAGGWDVDFVVVGFGLGALGVLLGVVMLGWLAPRAQRGGRTAEPDDEAQALAIAAEHRGTGQAFLYAGTAMLLATIGGLAGSLDDRTGALLVTTTATVAAIGILLGGYLHRARYPLPRRGSTSAAEAPAQGTDSPAEASIGLARAVDPSAAEAWSVDPDDENAHGAPLPVSGAVWETMADEAALPRANGRPAEDDVEPDRGEDVPGEASTGPESGRIVDAADDHRSDDTNRVEEEEALVVASVAPAAHPADLPHHLPSRPDEGEDPS
jgi:hypothetical protein